MCVGPAVRGGHRGKQRSLPLSVMHMNSPCMLGGCGAASMHMLMCARHVVYAAVDSTFTATLAASVSVTFVDFFFM